MSARSRPFRSSFAPPLLGACLVMACTSAQTVTPAGSAGSAAGPAALSPTTSADVPASAGSSTSAAPAVPSVSVCGARRPFVFASAKAEERLLALPAPFQAFDPCTALKAIFPDYDPATESSARAGGVVRARDAGLFLHGGRELLVLIDYRGKEAEEELVGGCDPFHAHVSLLARSPDNAQLTVVARGREPITHAGVGSAITIALGPSSSVALRENDPALRLHSEHGCGTAPARTAAHLLVLDGTSLRDVLGRFVGARGMQRDDTIHEIGAALGPKPHRPTDKDGFADLTLVWTDAACPFDDKAGDLVCGRGKPLGTDTYRYDGRAYVRRGPATKVPFL